VQTVLSDGASGSAKQMKLRGKINYIARQNKLHCAAKQITLRGKTI